MKIPKVIVPLLPAHFSALGMLMTDVKHDYVRTYYKPLLDADFDVIKQIYEEMASIGRKTLRTEGIDASSYRIQAFFDLRYIGQEFYLTVPVSEAEIYGKDGKKVRASFDKLHEVRYGHKATAEPIEIVNVRVTAYGLRRKISFPPKEETAAGQPIKGYREVYFQDHTQAVRCPLYDRDVLPAGFVIQGPAVIEEYASTTPLSYGDSATVSPSGEIIITAGGIA